MEHFFLDGRIVCDCVNLRLCFRSRVVDWLISYSSGIILRPVLSNVRRAVHQRSPARQLLQRGLSVLRRLRRLRRLPFLLQLLHDPPFLTRLFLTDLHAPPSFQASIYCLRISVAIQHVGSSVGWGTGMPTHPLRTAHSPPQPFLCTSQRQAKPFTLPPSGGQTPAIQPQLLPRLVDGRMVARAAHTVAPRDFDPFHPTLHVLLPTGGFKHKLTTDLTVIPTPKHIFPCLQLLDQAPPRQFQQAGLHVCRVGAQAQGSGHAEDGVEFSVGVGVDGVGAL